MKAEVEYTALVSVKVDLETGEVGSIGIRAARDDDETPSSVSVRVEGETDQPDEVFDRAQQLVDGAAPFEVSGWWAPAPSQRWTPVVDRATEADRNNEDPPLKLRRPPGVSPCGAARGGDHPPGRVLLRDRRG